MTSQTFGNGVVYILLILSSCITLNPVTLSHECFSTCCQHDGAGLKKYFLFVNDLLKAQLL